MSNPVAALSRAKVVGDVFLTRTCDDGRDKFERYDFTLSEFNPQAKWILDAGKVPPPPTTKPPPSEATIIAWQKQLGDWVASKLTQWDGDEQFRTTRQDKYPDRASYEIFLQEKADAKLKVKLA